MNIINRKEQIEKSQKEEEARSARIAALTNQPGYSDLKEIILGYEKHWSDVRTINNKLGNEKRGATVLARQEILVMLEQLKIDLLI